MKVKVISVLLFCANSLLFADQKIFTQLDADSKSGLTTSERVIYWSEYFLGRPYSSTGPLGEGKAANWDNDPLYRFDTFDCTTFVETTLALASSNDRKSFEREVINIRYEDDIVDYFHRAHIITYAWLPNIIGKNYISKQESAEWNYALKTTTTKFEYIPWLQQLNQQQPDQQLQQELLQSTLNSFSQQHPSTEIKSDYLEINLLMGNWNLFESGISGTYLVNIVRPDWNLEDKIGTDLLVSHQGWVYRDELSGEVTMVHASTSGQVVKLPLKVYLKRLGLSSTSRGIQLFKIDNVKL